MARPGFEIEGREVGGERALVLEGELRYQEAGELRRRLGELLVGAGRVSLDLAGVRAIDGATAGILAGAGQALRERGGELRFEGASAEVAALLAVHTARDRRACERAAPLRLGIVRQLGGSTLALLGELRGSLDFLGRLGQAVVGALKRPASVHWRELWVQMERVGADGLLIVLTIDFLIGLVSAFQAAAQLAQFGADIFVADMVALAMTRELGPLMTAIVVAGRSGAAISAELGTMQVSEEVDALRTLGFCPYRYLVLPRVMALAIVLPMLALLGDGAGIVGGVVIAATQLDVSTVGYVAQTRAALGLWDVGGGLLKAVVFGIAIGLIACERGLASRGGAEGVGRTTTSAVVSILFHLIVLDALFTIAYQVFGV